MNADTQKRENEMKRIDTVIEDIRNLQSQFPNVSVRVALDLVLADSENFAQLKEFKKALVTLLTDAGISGTHFKSGGRSFWRVEYTHRCGINIRVDEETETSILTGNARSWRIG